MICMVDNKEFNFMFNKPLELLYALIAVSLKDEVLKDADEKEIKDAQKTIDVVDNMQGRLSSYIRWEAQYFFHKNVNTCDGMGQLIYMGYLRDNPHVDTVEDMFEIIENSDECTMLSYVVKDVFYENTNKNINEVYNWDVVKNSINDLLKIINELEFFNDNMKQKLLESIENAAETKQRYIMLLRQFYEKAFKPVVEEIIKTVCPTIEKYEKEFKLDPKKFCRKYFVKDVSVFGPAVNIHVSLFRYAGSDYWSSKEGSEWIIFGSDTWRFLEDEPEKEKVLDFLKAISDKRRMTIIELLAEKSWYVNEIAERIGMSAATTSYHLTSLQELGIVDFERYDHRFYYYLNKDKLRELFNEAMKVYLHE